MKSTRQESASFSRDLKKISTFRHVFSRFSSLRSDRCINQSEDHNNIEQRTYAEHGPKNHSDEICICILKVTIWNSTLHMWLTYTLHNGAQKIRDTNAGHTACEIYIDSAIWSKWVLVSVKCWVDICAVRPREGLFQRLMLLYIFFILMWFFKTKQPPNYRIHTGKMARIDLPTEELQLEHVSA